MTETTALVKRAFRMAHKRIGTRIRFTKGSVSCELDAYYVSPGNENLGDEKRHSVLSSRYDVFVLTESLASQVDGKMIRPEHGDQIIDLNNNRTFDVVTVPQGCWKYVDALKTMIRIITQETTPCQ